MKNFVQYLSEKLIINRNLTNRSIYDASEPSSKGYCLMLIIPTIHNNTEYNSKISVQVIPYTFNGDYPKAIIDNNCFFDNKSDEGFYYQLKKWGTSKNPVYIRLALFNDCAIKFLTDLSYNKKMKISIYNFIYDDLNMIKTNEMYCFDFDGKFFKETEIIDMIDMIKKPL